MDIEYTYNGINFIWNEDKAKKNKSKHGISFEQAVNSFFDPFLKVVDANRNNEQRDAVIGMDEQWNLLFTVHIQIEEDEIRIISARKAVKKERKYYES